MAYPTTPHTVAAIVISRRSFGDKRLQNAAAVAGPPIAALDAMRTSSNCKSGRKQCRTNRDPKIVTNMCTLSAIRDTPTQAGPDLIAADTSADIPIALKKSKNAHDESQFAVCFKE